MFEVGDRVVCVSDEPRVGLPVPFVVNHIYTVSGVGRDMDDTEGEDGLKISGVPTPVEYCGYWNSWWWAGRFRKLGRSSLITGLLSGAYTDDRDVKRPVPAMPQTPVGFKTGLWRA